MPSLVEISLVFSKKIFFVNVFSLFVIICLWRRAWPFIWTNLNLIHPMMLCVKFGWNWPCGSGEEDFQNFNNIFTLSLLSPLGKGCGSSFEQTWIPFKRMLCIKFGWNWPTGSGEEENVRSLQQRQQKWHRQTTDKLLLVTINVLYIKTRHKFLPPPPHPLKQEHLLGGHKIYNFCRPFLDHHYSTLILSDLCLGVEKIFKEMMHFYYMTCMAMP